LIEIQNGVEGDVDLVFDSESLGYRDLCEFGDCTFRFRDV